MPLNCINFGFYFNELTSKVSTDTLTNIKERCKEFQIKLVQEIQKRIPKNVHILEQLSHFSPECTKNQSKCDITAIAVAFKDVCGDIEATNREWSILHRLEIDVKTSDEFWAKVQQDVNAAGEKRFNHIAALALALLSLPFSNASVERAFSVINIIKDKLRNKLFIKTVDAILRVRCLMKSCETFEPTNKMLQKFVTEIVYGGDIDDGALDIINNFDMLQNLPPTM